MTENQRYIYEVHTNYGSYLYDTEKDAITALEMLEKYENVKIDRREVSKKLATEGFFENFALSVSKCDIF